MSTLIECEAPAGSNFPTERRWRIAAWGAFLLLLGIYLLFHPGRIDIVDGQFRFDVAKGIVNQSGPSLSDFYLVQGPRPTNPTTGVYYSYYTAPASLIALPVMIVSRALAGPNLVADRFSFSLAGAFAAAFIAPLLIAFYRRLGFPVRQALAWTFVFGLTTLWWPGAETVFDQCQHGVVLLAMTLTAYDVAKRGGWGSALATGLLGGLLFNYRIPYIALLPVFPIYWIIEARRRRGEQPKSALIWQILLYCGGVAIGLAGYLYYNWIRFGEINMPPFDNGTPMVGNPVAGFLTLMVSPGKGFLWFSPPLLLAGFGLSSLLKADRGLGRLIVVLTVLHVGEMSCLSFAAGDWCWGPRYLLPILPLWALAFPYISFQVIKPRIVHILVGMGLLIQVMGVSIDHHRFFYYRRLIPHFWLDPWAYFRFSQLAARPAEIVESIAEWNRVRPRVNSGPNNDATYCPFGPPGMPDIVKPKPGLAPKLGLQKSPLQLLASAEAAKRIIQASQKPHGKPPPPPDPRVWQEQFRIFYLARPWWGWINHVPRQQRPVDALAFFIVCFVPTGVGAGLVLCASLPKMKGESRQLLWTQRI